MLVGWNQMTRQEKSMDLNYVFEKSMDLDYIFVYFKSDYVKKKII